MSLFNGNVLMQRHLKGDCKTQAELDKVQETRHISFDRFNCRGE